MSGPEEKLAGAYALLRAKSNEEKFAGLLLVSKLLNGNPPTAANASAADSKQRTQPLASPPIAVTSATLTAILDSVGLSFLLRLLNTKPDATECVSPYQTLAVNVLSTLCSEPSLAARFAIPPKPVAAAASTGRARAPLPSAVDSMLWMLHQLVTTASAAATADPAALTIVLSDVLRALWLIASAAPSSAQPVLSAQGLVSVAQVVGATPASATPDLQSLALLLLSSQLTHFAPNAPSTQVVVASASAQRELYRLFDALMAPIALEFARNQSKYKFELLGLFLHLLPLLQAYVPPPLDFAYCSSHVSCFCVVIL
jgi:hypothetical protein